MFDSRNHQYTSIEKLGEFGLIDTLTENFPNYHPSLLKGIGDDAAVIEQLDGKCLLVSTDILVEGTHFDCSYTPLIHLGYKSAIVNFSDIYAMNGKPTAITVGISVSNQYSVEALKHIYEGIRMACKEHEVDLIGGDTTSVGKGLYISITVLGMVAKNQVVYRSGAQNYDLIIVSGDLGGAYAGLQILEREKQVFLSNPEIQPDLSDYDYVIERQLRPRAKRDVVQLFRELSIQPSAMIDISDGLSNELNHIAKSSQKGMIIYQDKLPIDYQTGKVAEEFSIPATTFALHGGEDYELLFTLNQKDFDKIQGLSGFIPIGHVTDSFVGSQMVQSDHSVLELQPFGWNHFSKS